MKFWTAVIFLAPNAILDTMSSYRRVLGPALAALIGLACVPDAGASAADELCGAAGYGSGCLNTGVGVRGREVERDRPSDDPEDRRPAKPACDDACWRDRHASLRRQPPVRPPEPLFHPAPDPNEERMEGVERERLQMASALAVAMPRTASADPRVLVLAVAAAAIVYAVRQAAPAIRRALSRTRPDAEARQAEYERARDFCNTPPKPGADRCGTLSRQIGHAERCASLYEAWDAKWQPGRHASKIRSFKKRMRKLKAEHKKRCVNR